MNYQSGTLLFLKSRTLVCDPGGIRTHDPQLRRLLLYPAELPDQGFLVSRGSKIRTYDLLLPKQAR
jgi:hypothetical protein